MLGIELILILISTSLFYLVFIWQFYTKCIFTHCLLVDKVKHMCKQATVHEQNTLRLRRHVKEPALYTTAAVILPTLLLHQHLLDS